MQDDDDENDNDGRGASHNVCIKCTINMNICFVQMNMLASHLCEYDVLSDSVVRMNNIN